MVGIDDIGSGCKKAEPLSALELCKELVTECHPSQDTTDPPSVREHTAAIMKFGERKAYTFEFVTYDSKEAAETAILRDKEVWRKTFGDDGLKAVSSTRRPLVTYYAPINTTASVEASSKRDTALSFVRTQ